MERLIADANRVKEANGEMADLSIDSFANIVEALHIIQTEMGISGITADEAAELVASGAMTQEEAFELMGTTAKEAATTIQGSMMQMKASWQNWLTALADPDLDITAATENLIASIQTFADNAIPRIAEIGKGMWQVFSDGFDLLPEDVQERLNESLDVINQALEELTPAWESFIGSFEGLEPLLEPIGEAFMNIFDTLVYILTPISEVILAIGTLFVDAIVSFLDMAHNLDVWLETAPSEFMTFVDQANTWIGSLPSKFAAWFSGILGAAGAWITGMIDKGNAAIQGFLSAIKSKWSDVASWFSGMGGRIKDAIGDLGSTLLNAGKSVLQGFWDGLKSKWDSIKGWFSDITAQISDLKGPEEVDARLLVKNGHLIMDGLLGGMQDGWENVEDFLHQKTIDIPMAIGVSNVVSNASRDGSSAGMLRTIAELLASIDKNMPTGIDLNGREFGRLIREYA